VAAADLGERTANAVAEAMTARDFAALGELLADDVVLNSPITAAFQFHGRDEIIELLRVVRETYEELEYTEIFGERDDWVQVFRTTVNGQPMQGMDLMRLDASGRVAEFTVFFRPLPGLATLTAALAPAVAPTRPRAVVARALTAPLAAATRLGERVIPRIAGR
jgi:hypothetical protein